MADTILPFWISMALATIVGVVLGALYFGGLWWTVHRLPRTTRPLPLYFGSLVVRLGMILTAFYGVLVYFDWPPLVAALLGFFVARLVTLRFVGLPAASPAEAVGREAA